MEEEQQRGDHIHARHREGETDLAGIDVREEHRQRLCVRVLEEDQRLLDHVPVVDEDQYRDRIERRAALRQADLREDLPLGRAVDLGGLDQRVRDAAHEFGQQKDRKRREHAGQDDRPGGVDDAQPRADEEVRHQRDLIGHEHQDHVEKEDAVPQLAAPARKAVRRHRGDRHLKDHDRQHQQDAVPVFDEVIRRFDQTGNILRERHPVGDEFEVDVLRDEAAARGGKDHAVVRADLAFRHERVGEGQHRRQQEKHREHEAEQKHDTSGEGTFLLHPSTSFPNQSSILNSSAMRTTITAAMMTAAAESFW